MSRIVADLSLFHYDAKRKTLSAPSKAFYGKFPVELWVKSHHTGREVLFVRDTDAWIRHEGWDGEQMQYVPAEENTKVVSLTIYHGE